MKHPSKCVLAYRDSVNQMLREVLITYCVCDILFNGSPCMPTENIMMLQCLKYGIQATSKGLSAGFKCVSL